MLYKQIKLAKTLEFKLKAKEGNKRTSKLQPIYLIFYLLKREKLQ